jgi:hypothetical protein
MMADQQPSSWSPNSTASSSRCPPTLEWLCRTSRYAYSSYLSTFKSYYLVHSSDWMGSVRFVFRSRPSSPLPFISEPVVLSCSSFIARLARFYWYSSFSDFYLKEKVWLQCYFRNSIKTCMLHLAIKRFCL